jgi:hypothetical protein
MAFAESSMRRRYFELACCALMFAVQACALPVVASVAGETATQDGTDPAKVEFFESRIRPILVEHCYECHGPEAKIVQANLRVDSREGLLQGGDTGPALTAGNPGQSLLMESLRYEGLRMPPQGKLSPSVLRDFEVWIANGAVDPRVGNPSEESSARFDSVAAQSHWAFQSLKEVTVPAMRERDDSNHPIDRFVRKRLRDQGWEFAPAADPLVLLRRATLDVTGLPPTMEEIEDYLTDDPSDRYERLIDRLLASPQYGVRWGRHWLDTVRYADSNGADENHEMPNAWRYRDWVSAALNEDMPYDTFVMQQLAGDLLPVPEDELQHGKLLTATGYWVLGPKMLAEQDKVKMKIDIVDEQIDTFSRGMLGVTLSCARCHDHKFDPLTQQDYYAVAGILMSTRAMADEAFVSKWMERPLPSQAVHRERLAHQERIDAARARLTQAREADKLSTSDGDASDGVPVNPAEKTSSESGKIIETLAQELEVLEKGMPPFEMAMAVEDGAPLDLPIHVRGNHLRPGDETIPRGAPDILQRSHALDPIERDASGRLQLARWVTHPDHPLLARVMVNRVWMWHFGQGLVRSPSNFGLRGDPPSHPELLDWLAKEWIVQGWSMKWLHRQILMSQTYRMRSVSGEVHESDPENRLLWRQNPRRLEIEPLRDSILQTSGRLDLRLHGPGQPLSSPKRTSYLSINRAALPDFFSVFDYVDPASHIEQRPVTNVPSQALFLMNSDLVMASANAFARTLVTHSQDRPHQIEHAFRRLLGRWPTPGEHASSMVLLEQAERVARETQIEEENIAALSALVRTLMATREFSWIE